MKPASLSLLGALVLFAGVTWGAPPPVVTLDAARFTLGDISPTAPSEIADTDLGPTPPPGGSRLVTRDEIRRRLAAGGVQTDAPLPSVVRVISAVKTLSADDLATWVEPHLVAALGRGESVVKIAPRSAVQVSPRASVGRVELSRVPRRAGIHKCTAVVELTVDGAVAQRLTIPATIELSEDGARADVQRGAQVEVVIETNGARVSAAAVAMADTNLGETATFQVVKTRKILRARLESSHVARVVAN